MFVFFATFVSPDRCCSYTVGDSTMLVVTGGQTGGAGSWNVATSTEVKYCWGQNTIEVKVLLKSKYFIGQYSLGVNLAQRLRYFWSQFFTEGKIEMQLLIKASKMQIIQFVTTSTKGKRCNLLLLGQILDFRDGGAWRHAEGRSTTSMLVSKFDAILTF